MKKIFALAIVSLSMASCSTCYECSEEVIISSGNTPVDTQLVLDELCTADQSEIVERESEGATCESI